MHDLFEIGIEAVKTYRYTRAITIFTWDGDLGKSYRENLVGTDWAVIDGVWTSLGNEPDYFEEDENPIMEGES
jgi:hypothetical protein